MGDDVDFEAEGLLEGCDGAQRESRLKLLADLHDRGVGIDELRRAVTEGRLPLVAVDRVLSGEGKRLTAAEVAERAEVDEEFLERQWRALGMALAGDDEPVYSERDVEAAKRLATIRAAGVPDEGILEIGRLLGLTMSQLAAANRRVIGEAFGAQSDDEYETAKQIAAAAEHFLPLIGDTLAYVLQVHLREQIRHDAYSGGGARDDGSEVVTVCFADMVGFTQLGEKLAPDELGDVTGRLNELAVSVVEPPVRLVKLIGDAAMLVGPETEPVLEAGLELVAAAAREGGEFPILRAGVACGEAMPRSGDWYGRPVNLASRITARARPGSVLVSEEVHEALGDAYEWSFAGGKHLKGIDGEVKLYRARRPGEDGEGERNAEPGLAASLLEGVGDVLGDVASAAEPDGDDGDSRRSKRRRSKRD